MTLWRFPGCDASPRAHCTALLAAARVIAMVASITPLVASAYCVIGIFYACMATLGGQGRPMPVALAFFLGAFLLAPTTGAALTFVAHCCGSVRLDGLWLGLIAGYSVRCRRRVRPMETTGQRSLSLTAAHTC